MNGWAENGISGRTVGLLSLMICGWVISAAEHATSADPNPATATKAATPVAKPTAKLLNGAPPTNLEELKYIQGRIQRLRDKIMAATVAIQVGRANGSGVIVDPAGHVLTAAHVAGRPGRVAMVFLPNGRTVRGKTLGMNQELDAGMIEIVEPGPWPHVPMGASAQVQEGQFCLATGHPGGYDTARPPVLRWGRVLKVERTAILTDCTLVGGDSGGPLFDLDGKVVGIHSRIGKNLTINVHVPIDPFRESWDRLAQGEVWGLLEDEAAGEPAPKLADGRGAAPEIDPGDQHARRGPEPRRSALRPESESSLPAENGAAWLGVIEDPLAKRVRILHVVPGSPAAEAGLLAGDEVERIADVPVHGFQELQDQVRRRGPGRRVLVQIRRNGQVHEVAVRLGRRPPTEAG